MTSGGARNRSGPSKSEDSGRSDRTGYSLSSLPAEGYDGPVPEWPTPNPRDRDLAWWAWAWTTPQACAWSTPSESWRVPWVAEWCETKTDLEESRTAALLSQKFRMEDRIGFSTAGLAEMGWKVVVDETATKRSEKSAASAPKSSSRNRMQVVKNDGA